jgi:hypothetical protein
MRYGHFVAKSQIFASRKNLPGPQDLNEKPKFRKDLFLL